MIRKTLAAALLAGGALLAPVGAFAGEAAPAEVVALAEVPRGRLTDAAVPKAYRVDTRFDPGLAGFSGRTEIDIELAAPSRFIDLHGRNLKMLSAEARVGDRVWAGTWHQVDASGVGRLVFDETLPKGPMTLMFTYTGGYQDQASGLFRTQIEGKWYGWSQFQSIDARAAFPGFDEPGFKVPFTVTIRNKPGEVAVSNAPEVSSTVEDGWQVHRFAPTLPLPTYLVAMMSGPFAVAESTVPPTPQRTEPLPLRIVTTQNNAAKMAYALEESKPIVALLEEYFGTRFPYPKLDQISSPLMGGAMENAGADLYADDILILDDNAPAWQRKIFGMVVAHELAHQWFGDLVTPAWWDDIWLNESFANWMGFTIGGAWKPELEIADGALGEGFGAMGTDSLLAGRPIHQPIPTNDKIDAAFDTITYGKGGHVVAMIAAYMGPEKFREGVRGYMGAHRYGNATSSDFFGAMARAAGDPRITQAMMSFTDQQGVPLVTVSGGESGTYTITQSRYAPLGVTAPATRWGVPVCMRRGDGRACTLLADATTTIKLSGGSGALVPNASGTGYYRFELPAAEWDRLIASANSLEEAEVMALTSSLGASFRAGRASPQQLLTLARTLTANPDGRLAVSGIQLVSGLRNSGFLSADGIASYERWIAALAAPEVAKLGLDLRRGAYASESADAQERRQGFVSLATMAGDAEVTRKLVAATEAYLAGDAGALDPSYLGFGFEALIETGGLAAAKRLADKALASEDSLFRGEALGTIFSSGNLEIARWALEEWKDTRLRPSEALRGALGVVATGDTRDYGYQWLLGNLDTIMKGSSGIFLARAVPGTLGGFCSAEVANQIEQRLTPAFTGTSGALEFARTLERIRNCAKLKDARGAEFDAAVRAL